MPFVQYACVFVSFSLKSTYFIIFHLLCGMYGLVVATLSESIVIVFYFKSLYGYSEVLELLFSQICASNEVHACQKLSQPVNWNWCEFFFSTSSERLIFIHHQLLCVTRYVDNSIVSVKLYSINFKIWCALSKCYHLVSSASCVLLLLRRIDNYFNTWFDFLTVIIKYNRYLSWCVSSEAWKAKDFRVK